MGKRKNRRTGAPAATPDRDQFAAELRQAIQHAGETAAIEYDPDSFSLRADRQVLNLYNAYQEYEQSALWQRPDVLRQWTRMWSAMSRGIPQEYADARPDLLPVVRGRAYYERKSLPFEVLGEHHAVGLVYDMPELMADVPQGLLDRWGVGFAQAYQDALRNLRAISLPPRFALQPEGLHVSDYHDEYDPSRLLLPEVIDALAVRGDPVVMAANTTTLLVTGSDDARGLSAMATLTLDVLGRPHFVSGLPLRRVGGQWEAFRPGAGHPTAAQLQQLWTITLGSDYEWQQQQLEALHKREGRDVFVAGYYLVGRPETVGLLSYCCWTESVLSLLPRTDVVCFGLRADVEAGRHTGIIPVRWEAVRAIASDLLVATGLYPERYRVERFPDGAQLEALRARRLGTWPPGNNNNQ
jgi:hypothetical protein